MMTPSLATKPERPPAAVASSARALGNYGGLTQTMRLMLGSPAIGNGVAINGIYLDQRDFARSATAPSIGAYEFLIYTINVTISTDVLYNDPSANVDQLVSPVSLRDAINAANNTGGLATINLAASTTYTFNTEFQAGN